MSPVIAIEVLGADCRRCRKMAENAEKAAEELGLEYRLTRVTDVEKIVDYDVLMVPALVINGQVKVVGRVPDVEEIKKLFQVTLE